MTTMDDPGQSSCQSDDDWQTLVREVTALAREHVAREHAPPMGRAVANAGRLVEKAAEERALYASLRRQMRLLHETMREYRRVSGELRQLVRMDDGA